MIEIKNLTKNYGRVKALNNIDFTVEKGEIVGFLGPNGAGKSTTMNIIAGYIPPSEGTVRVAGYDIHEKPIEVKKRIGYLPEQPPLNPNMTVLEYLDFVSELKRVDKKDRKIRQSEILEVTSLTDVSHRLIRNLSKGYKQRVGLAQALIGNPEVLILDEPTVGLDPTQIIEIRKLVKDLGREHTIILSSHILPEVSAVCGRVVIISKGEIIAVDTPENLSKNFSRHSSLQLTAVGPSSRVISLLNGIDGVNQVHIQQEEADEVITYILDTKIDADIRGEVSFALARDGYRLLELKSIDISLEDIFIRLVTKEKEVE
jgi:ABC-2 type transport system ATP-binding protein